MVKLIHTRNLPEERVSTSELLVTRADHIVAASVNLVTYSQDQRGEIDEVEFIFKGELVFLPLLPSGAKASIQHLLQNHGAAQTEDAIPDWADALTVHGQTELDDSIKKLDEKIYTLTTQQESLADKRTELRKTLEIL